MVEGGGGGGYGMRIGRRSRNRLVVSFLYLYIDECGGTEGLSNSFGSSSPAPGERWGFMPSQDPSLVHSCSLYPPVPVMSLHRKTPCSSIHGPSQIGPSTQ